MARENDIEWDEVKDNLKIFRVDEKEFTDLGNPFGAERPYIPQPKLSKPVYVRPKSSIPKLYIVLIAILFFVLGLFLGAVSRSGSDAGILEIGGVRHLEILYSPDGEPILYSVQIIVGKEHVYRSFIMNLDEIKPFSIEKDENGIKFTNESPHELQIRLPDGREINISPGKFYLYTGTRGIPFDEEGNIVITVVDLKTDTEYIVKITQQVIVGAP